MDMVLVLAGLANDFLVPTNSRAVQAPVLASAVLGSLCRADFGVSRFRMHRCNVRKHQAQRNVRGVVSDDPPVDCGVAADAVPRRLRGDEVERRLRFDLVGLLGEEFVDQSGVVRGRVRV